MVFLDSVGVIALWNLRDQWNSAATAALAPIVAAKTRLVTTTLVLYECGNAASRMPFRGQVFKTYRSMSKKGNLIVPTDADIEEGWNEYARAERGSAGIVDRLSFAVMRRLGLTKAFTNDRHISAAGFEILF